MNGNWLTQSFFAMLCLVPAWLTIGFFDKNYQIKSDVFLIWYLLGIVTTSIFFGGSTIDKIFPSLKMVAVMMLIGMTIGATANILLFRAVSAAPNPGLAVAIGNTASVGVFLAALLLSRYAPNYFNEVKFDAQALVGIILTVVGAALIAIRR